MVGFLLLLLQFTGALSSDVIYFTVRPGDDVTFPCNYVIEDHRNCDTTTWLYSKSGEMAVEIVNHGNVKNTRSDRLSVSTLCSLVLKNVRAEDVGRYTCRQFRPSGSQQIGPDTVVQLSVVSLTEDQNQNQVTLRCSVVTDGWCKHEVRWLVRGQPVEKDNPNIRISSSSCSADVSIQTSHYFYPERFNLLKCEVKAGDNKVQLFTFNSHPSEKDKTTTIPSLTPNLKEANHGLLWLYITLPLVLLVMMIAVVVFILLKRNKGNKTEQNSRDGAGIRPPETQSVPENLHHEVDLGNDVSYACISYTKKSSCNRATQDKESDAVTYSTVRASSTDPSCLYASINKQ